MPRFRRGIRVARFRRETLRVVAPGILAVFAAAGFAAPAAAQFAIPWFTVDGGGGMHALGGAFTLSGTIGQPDAGAMSGIGFSLGGGFWNGGGTVVGVEGDAPAAGLPRAFQLHPAAPNPLLRTTVVAFDLAEARAVSVRVYDVTGRLTRTLAQGTLPAGRHQRVWDGTDDSGRPVPAGLCLVRVEAGGERAAQKILVIR